MNGHVIDLAAKVKAEEVQKARELMASLLEQVEIVASLYRAEREVYQTWQASLSNVEELVNSRVSEADYEASISKTGPLAGIARTSEAYKMAVKKIRSELLTGELSVEWAETLNLEADYRQASIEYESAKTRYGALKTVSELQSAILRVLAA